MDRFAEMVPSAQKDREGSSPQSTTGGEGMSAAPVLSSDDDYSECHPPHVAQDASKEIPPESLVDGEGRERKSPKVSLSLRMDHSMEWTPK
jgi:hypothetical protein